jgi:hypothetical protein
MRRTSWAGLALAACLAALAPGAGASGSAVYADAAGDASPAAPDVTDVQVSNDDAGNVVFRISVPNRAELEDSDFVALLLDADRSSRTGCARGTFGAEYALDVLARKYVFGRCSAGQWNFTKKPPSFAGSFADSTLTLKVNRRDIGRAGGFDVRIGAAASDAAGVAYEFAPDIGVGAWSYKIVAPPEAIKKPPKRHAHRVKKRRR